MTSQTFPLQSLLLQLESHGYRLDPARQMRLQEALLKLGAEYRDQPEALGRLLTPLIAQDAQEQQEVQQLITAYLERLWEEPRFAERQNPTEEIEKQLKQKRILAYVVAFSLFVGGMLFWQGNKRMTNDRSIVETQAETAITQSKESTEDSRIKDDPSLNQYPRLESLDYQYETTQFGTRSVMQFSVLPQSRWIGTEVKWEIFQDGQLIETLTGEVVNFFAEQYGSFELKVRMYYPGGPESASISKEQAFLYL
ncbi:MAG: hypothetical protein AAGM67_14880, partial [Bacteroidota bacterium]